MKKNFPNPIDIRKKIIELLYSSKASHLGSNMSAVEMLIAIFSSINTEKIKSQSENRSRVFISKGHCACATYTVMNFFGLIKDKDLVTYHKDGSFLAGHISHSADGVEHSTGALGHGISVAVGAAIGLKSKFNANAPISFALCGDGEIQEGSVWEALMLAGHLNLKNFVLLIDYNKISSIKETNKVVNLEPLSDKLSSFGFTTQNVDGHNINEIYTAINNNLSNKPQAIICHTIKGKGISFAENEPIWHYRTLDEKLYLEAKKNLK